MTKGTIRDKQAQITVEGDASTTVPSTEEIDAAICGDTHLVGTAPSPVAYERILISQREALKGVEAVVLARTATWQRRGAEERRWMRQASTSDRGQ